MRTSAFPTLDEIRERHTHLIERLRAARHAEKLSPVDIPPALAEEIAGVIDELRGMGATLYADGDRSATQSLMSYWINALYRAEWYQKHEQEPPAPELAPFAPESQPPLTDEDYPWPRCDRPSATPELPALWRRLSAAGVEILKTRRVLGVTGAAGCGRSNLIANGLLPAIRQAGFGELAEHSLSPDEDFAGDGAAGSEQDLVFLSPLLKIARALPGAPALDAAALIRDPAALARLLDASGRRHLVVVQDLHHLFMLSDDPFELEPSAGQRAFIDALSHIAASERGHYLIVDLQTDYLSRLRLFPELHALLERPAGASGSDGWLIVSLESEELRQFIVEPADRVGLHFEAGLVDRIVFEHQSEPAAVTILLFTLRRLWTDMLTNQDRRNMIVWQNYQRVGSGRLVLELAADEATKAVLDHEPGAEEPALDAIRRVFIELVRLMPGSAWWLPRVPRATVEARLVRAGHPPTRIARVVDEFAHVGLFVELPAPSGGTTLRIFHDALVSRWTRLVQWLEDERTAKRLRWVLRADAREWHHLLSPSPEMAHASWSARCRDAIARFERRQSRLWRGAKLREAAAFHDLPAREEAFLSQSRRAWYATFAIRTLAIAALPVLLIVGLASLEQHNRSILATVFLDRGVNSIADGDPGLTGALWLTAAHKLNVESPERRAIGWLPKSWLPASVQASDAAHQLSIGMAFHRVPALHNLVTVDDGLIAVETSPSGRFAALGCRTQGNTPGQVLLWDLDGKAESLVKPDEGVSIDRVTFARSANNTADTLLAVGGSTGKGDQGVIFIWDLRQPAHPRLKIETATRVRDLVFLPAPADASRQQLAIALGDETSLPVRGGAAIYEITAAGDGPRAGEALKLTRPGKTLPVDLPATHLAVSTLGTLAVSYVDPASDTGRVAIYEKRAGGGWVAAELGADLSPVADLAFSNDRRETLALGTAKAGSSAGNVRIFRREESAWIEPGPPLQLGSGILRVAFNPVGGSLLATAANGALGIWSVDDLGATKSIREIAEGGWPFSAAWSPDGRRIATGNRDRHARLWDVGTGRLVLPPLYHGATVSNVAFTPDGLRLLATTVQSARLWSTAPREFSLLPVRAVERATQSLMSTDGHRIAVASRLSGQSRDGVAETELALWQDDQLAPAVRYPHLPALSRIAIGRDGALVAALTQRQNGDATPQELLVWNPAARKTWKIAVEPGADFLGIVPGAPARILVAGSTPPPPAGAASADAKVGFLQCFDLSQDEPKAVAVPLDFRVRAIVATANGGRVVIGGDGGASLRGGMIATVDLAGAAPVVGPRLNRHAEAVTSLALSKNGNRLLSGSIDDSVKLVAIDANGGLQVLAEQKPSDEQKHTADVTSVGFSHDSTRAVSTGRDSAAILYDVSGDRLKVLAVMEHRGVVGYHAFSEDDQWLATGGDDGVSLWYAGTKHTLWQGKRVAVLPHRYPAAGVAFASAKQLRTLALERSPDTSSSAQVEAYTWGVEPGSASADETQHSAELLAGRKLVGIPPAPVNLRASEAQELWKNSSAASATENTIADELRNQALSAATASDWRAARTHLLALRAADPAAFDAKSDTLKFAAEVFEAARDPGSLLTATAALLPLLGDSPDDQRIYRDRHGVACLQLARAAAAGPERDKLLADAEADFSSLAQSGADRWWWRVREAEVNVLRRNWPRALECLEESKRLLAEAREALGEVGIASSGTQDQRIAAIYLLQAAEARMKGNAEVAAKAEADWHALAKATLAQHANAKPTAKARAAWPAVLGEANDPELAATAVAFAEEGCKERPDSFARANTLATALLRAGRLDESSQRLAEAIRSFERERKKTEQPGASRETRREGRSADWIIRSLLYYARSQRKPDDEKKSVLLSKAREDLAAARAELDKPVTDTLSQWRATWNNLDLRVLVAEADRKFGDRKSAP